MSLALATRFDTWLWFSELESKEWMQQRRLWLAVMVVAASVADLYLTQSILTLVHGLSGHQPAEANPFMAGLVMTWWAWPIRVGIPCLAVVRDLRAGNYGLITFAAAVYSLVVVWNLGMLVQVEQLL
jgi:hypothetical protein